MIKLDLSNDSQQIYLAWQYVSQCVLHYLLSSDAITRPQKISSLQKA